MTEYEYVHRQFDKDSTIDIPGNAIGVTVTQFGDDAVVKYLEPTYNNEDP